MFILNLNCNKKILTILLQNSAIVMQYYYTRVFYFFFIFRLMLNWCQGDDTCFESFDVLFDYHLFEGNFQDNPYEMSR